jgi:signal peptidase I
MSGDSREFGFVPEDNLKGGPTFIFWPPGSRWGVPNQKGYPWWNLPRVIVWTLGVGAMIGSSLYYRRKHKKPLVF